MKKCRFHFKGTSIALTFLLLSFLLWNTNAYSQLANSTLVKGVVQNMKDEPLSDVSIVIKNAKTNFTAGTVSNSNGSFQFSGIPSGGPYTFTITAVGYEAQVMSGYNLKIESSLTLLVKLDSKTVSMESVVVVGYGSLKRKDLTGAVGSVSSKDFKDLGISRIDQSIAGRVAGVQVKSTSGEPGAGPQIRIRGVGSISAGVSPLYVVDGFPVDNIQTLNPNDIQNIDILKDASATAIYGSRGSNGVVIINTVRGKSGKSTLGFDTYYGMQRVSKIPEMKNSVQQAQWWLDGMRNKNIDDGRPVTGSPDTWAQSVPRVILDILEGKNTTDVEPLESILIDAPQKTYALSASGGTESVRYALSGEFLQQDGIVINSGFERYSVRANIDAKLTERLTLKLNLNPSFTDQRALPSTGVCCLGAGVVAAALNILPHRPMLDDQGNYFNYDGLADMAAVYNPLAVAQETKVSNKMDRLLANVNAEYEITKDLKFNILLGGSVINTKGMLFKPQRAYFFNDLAFGSDNSSKITNWLSEYTLNYNKILGKHNITGLAGYTVQKENGESNSLSSNRFPNNLVPTLSAVSNLITAGTSNQYQWTLLSYLARANYNYDSKYYVTASIRTDGSSRFGRENKYGLFPSFALAWRVSNEKFLKNVTFLNEFKIRTSYGQTGSNNIGNYDQFATLNYDNYTLGNAAFSGTAPGRLGNPFLTWEKQSSVNVGIDASIFKRRVNITVDHFNSRNTDLLLNVNIPNVTGFSTALQNIGEVKNTGWEFVLNTVNINGRLVNWSTDFNLSAYRNEVVKLGPQGDPIYVGNNITKIGQPIGMFFGFLTDGIFKNAAELSAGPIFNPGAADRSRVGDIRFKDISGPAGKPDGIINNFDNTIMGSPYPDFYYGITNKVSYKDIMLSFTVQGSDGSQIYALSRDGGYSGRARVRGYAFSNNYWKSEAEPGDGLTPRPNDTPKGGFRLPNQKYLDNGTYLRVNNITLSYNFPNTWAKKMKLSSLRIYANALNPFLFTKNTAFNPDVSTNDNPLSPGLESNDYPLPKGIIFGLNVKF